MFSDVLFFFFELKNGFTHSYIFSAFYCGCSDYCLFLQTNRLLIIFCFLEKELNLNQNSFYEPLIWIVYEIIIVTVNCRGAGLQCPGKHAEFACWQLSSSQESSGGKTHDFAVTSHGAPGSAAQPSAEGYHQHARRRVEDL